MKMEMEKTCCCCLVRPPDKDLYTPHIFFGVTETFSDLLEECFQIYFTAGLDNVCGICEVCVGRLRDASDFKLQVQRSQAELQARLVRAQSVKGEDLVEFKFEDDDKLLVREDLMLQCSDADVTVKSEVVDDYVNDGQHAACREQSEIPWLELACSAALERLKDDKTLTSPQQSSLTTHMRVRAEQLTERTERRDLTSAAAGAETYTCDTCGEQFARKCDIVTHLKKHGENKLYSKQVTVDTLVISKRSRMGGKPFGVCYKKFFEKPLITRHNVVKPYSCHICKKRFIRQSNLNVHIRYHTGQKSRGTFSKVKTQSVMQLKPNNRTNDEPYTCDVCQKQFIYKSHLIEHVRFHTGQKLYNCKICSEKFYTSSNLTRHRLIHTGAKPFKCNVCKKQFSRKYDLSVHKRLHTGLEPYTCEVCYKKFSNSSNLARHKRIHIGETPLPFSSEKLSQNELVHRTNEPYTCDVCKRQFSRKSDLSAHIRSHVGLRPYSCKICRKKFANKTALSVHIRFHTGEKPYECKDCYKKFFTSSHLARHNRSHTGDRPNTCKICKETFINKYALSKHIISLHKRQGYYDCQVCSKKFSTSSNLARHRRSHTGDICNKQFTCRSNLNVHIRNHIAQISSSSNISPTKMFKKAQRKQKVQTSKRNICNICNKRFKDKYKLSEHIRFHTGERPFECNVCYKKFFTKSNLTRHKQVHAGDKLYTCDTCKTQFGSKSSLAEHSRIHHGLQLYYCEVCSETFRLSSDFRRHKAIHADHKPYSCDVCKQQFKRKSNLTVHVRNHAAQ